MWTASDRETYKDDGRRYQSDLTNAEWSAIKPLFDHYRTYTVDLREVLNAIFYLEKTGCQWRLLPKEFGAWQTIRTWYDRFRREGVWEEINQSLVPVVRKMAGRNPQPTTGLIDSQSVTSGPQAGARGCRWKQAHQRRQAPSADLLDGTSSGCSGHSREYARHGSPR